MGSSEAARGFCGRGRGASSEGLCSGTKTARKGSALLLVMVLALALARVLVLVPVLVLALVVVFVLAISAL